MCRRLPVWTRCNILRTAAFQKIQVSDTCDNVSRVQRRCIPSAQNCVHVWPSPDSQEHAVPSYTDDVTSTLPLLAFWTLRQQYSSSDSFHK
jgi:hypothetical protein